MTVLYSFTLRPETTIPDDAAPAAGWDEAEAAQLAAVSAEYGVDDKIDVAVAEVGVLEVEVTLSGPGTKGHDADPNADIPGLAIDWTWGDGGGETGADLIQHHQYQQPGSYPISAIVNVPGRPSFALYTQAIVA